MIKEIVTYIADNTSFTTGVDLFVDAQQDAQDTCLFIREMPETETWSGLTRMRILVTSRAMDYFEARDNLYVVHDLINMKGFTLTSYEVLFCDALSMPQSAGFDFAGRRELVAIYILYVKEV